MSKAYEQSPEEYAAWKRGVYEYADQFGGISPSHSSCVYIVRMINDGLVFQKDTGSKRFPQWLHLTEKGLEEAKSCKA